MRKQQPAPDAASASSDGLGTGIVHACLATARLFLRCATPQETSRALHAKQPAPVAAPAEEDTPEPEQAEAAGEAAKAEPVKAFVPGGCEGW